MLNTPPAIDACDEVPDDCDTSGALVGPRAHLNIDKRSTQLVRLQVEGLMCSLGQRCCERAVLVVMMDRNEPLVPRDELTPLRIDAR